MDEEQMEEERKKAEKAAEVRMRQKEAFVESLQVSGCGAALTSLNNILHFHVHAGPDTV
jgi:hypothetical protein